MGAAKYQGNPCLHGHSGIRFVSNNGCIECLRASARRYYTRNPEKFAGRTTIWARKNPEKNAAHSAKWRSRNRDKANASSARWVEQNPRKSLAIKKHHAAQRRGARMPEWADAAAIRLFYENCPVGMHVDHIIPIRGYDQDKVQVVSGLHVQTNLQYLTVAENVKKGNKWRLGHL